MNTRQFPVRDKRRWKRHGCFLFNKRIKLSRISPCGVLYRCKMSFLEILQLPASNTVSYLSMDSFRGRFCAVKRQSPAYWYDKLLPASKSCFESRGPSADRFWTESSARLFRLDTCSIRVRDFYESRRNEKRIERKGTPCQGTKGTCIARDVPLERSRND